MKTLMKVLLLTLICTNVIGQELKYEDLNTGTKPKGPFTSYECKDGTVYNVNDYLTIGYPSGGDFVFITNQSDFLATMEALNGKPQTINKLGPTESNTKTQIKNIVLGGSKRNGYYVYIKTKGMLGKLASTYTIQIENAIDAGEIKSDRFSSEDALNDLKRAKEKLDLGLITQEQYDSIKLVLGKYIK